MQPIFEVNDYTDTALEMGQLRALPLRIRTMTDGEFDAFDKRFNALIRGAARGEKPEEVSEVLEDERRAFAVETIKQFVTVPLDVAKKNGSFVRTGEQLASFLYPRRESLGSVLSLVKLAQRLDLDSKKNWNSLSDFEAFLDDPSRKVINGSEKVEPTAAPVAATGSAGSEPATASSGETATDASKSSGAIPITK